MRRESRTLRAVGLVAAGTTAAAVSAAAISAAITGSVTVAPADLPEAGPIVTSPPEPTTTTTVAPPTTLPPATAPPTTTTTTTTTTTSTTTTTTAVPAPTTVALVSVIDGDTIDVRLADGPVVRVRLIGIDTPERGDCGYTQASRHLESLLRDGDISLVAAPGDDTDRFGRLLRYVEVGGDDRNLAMIASGYAIARFDGLDGYDAHPRQDAYRYADALTPPAYDCAPTPPSAATDVYYPNCAAARAAGAAPLVIGQPGYRSGLDGDDDGVACE